MKIRSLKPSQLYSKHVSHQQHQ